MIPNSRLQPSIFVIFGFAGDLSWRKLYPALYDLFLADHLPEQFAILGVGHQRESEAALRQKLKDGVEQFSRLGSANPSRWDRFDEHLAFVAMDLESSEAFGDLSQKLAAIAKDWPSPVNRIFYLALPPQMIETVVLNLAKSRLNRDRQHVRVVIEKPFGHDLESARQLNRLLRDNFEESQIFRIDHYLGKETVQNILAFRFANILFEPIWNRRYIDHVQITVAESVGVELRGHYYDRAGALRDMIQNHLLQILCLVAMEAPISFEAEELRNKKVDVLHAIRPIKPDQVSQFAVRGQYGGGWLAGEHFQAYRAEPNVAPDSGTETFAAIKFFVDNWRWQGVPFYLRTGKRLPAKISEVAIQFRPVPHQAFSVGEPMDWRPNRLLIAIQPEEGILLRFEAKYPGMEMRLSPVMMQFYYREAFQVPSPDAYETLLLDIIRGDASLFMRADQAEAAWNVVTPILQVWQAIQPRDFPNYQSGTWGPEAADMLIAQDGRSWIMPTFLLCREDAVCRVLPEPSLETDL
jgi:glucose-6-phosphate 1-dehydrogenase